MEKVLNLTSFLFVHILAECPNYRPTGPCHREPGLLSVAFFSGVLFDKTPLHYVLRPGKTARWWVLFWDGYPCYREVWDIHVLLKSRPRSMFSHGHPMRCPLRVLLFAAALLGHPAPATSTLCPVCSNVGVGANYQLSCSCAQHHPAHICCRPSGMGHHASRKRKKEKKKGTEKTKSRTWR